ncbi:MAG: gentisate 1,2-dioxygenase [Bdellovibrionota bacterium]
MSDAKAKFIDKTGAEPPAWKPVPPVIIPRADLEAEVERLAKLPAPANGRRVSTISHPYPEMGGTLAAGINVDLLVLKPGEKTKKRRQNSTQVHFCIRGGGKAIVGGKAWKAAQYDVWNVPAWTPYELENDTKELQVLLCYSNGALLDKMGVHIVDETLSPTMGTGEEKTAPGGGGHHDKNPFGTFEITEEGAKLMPYEILVNPPVVEDKPLFWPWKKVKEHLDKLAALGQDYRGRRLYLLYNPATGRTNGTTPSFFATITIRPAKIADRPHRHVSTAINYFFSGEGHSLVENKRYDWKAGDLMLTAPGWARHCHISHDEPVYELTIQDSPLNIAMESLLWQEDLARPISVLGAQYGFDTNREKLAG